MRERNSAQIAAQIMRYGIPLLAIAAGTWLILRTSGDGASGMRSIALTIFNAPIIAISITLPFVGSLRTALQEKGPAGPIESTSYSRITGLFGAVVITSFFWAMGNVLLFYMIEDTGKIEGIIDGVWKFFVLGSALFLPYAFNQLRAIVTDRQAHTVVMEQLKLAPGVVTPGTPGVKVLANKP